MCVSKRPDVLLALEAYGLGFAHRWSLLQEGARWLGWWSFSWKWIVSAPCQAREAADVECTPSCCTKLVSCLPSPGCQRAREYAHNVLVVGVDGKFQCLAELPMSMTTERSAGCSQASERGTKAVANGELGPRGFAQRVCAGEPEEGVVMLLVMVRRLST